MAVLFQRKKEIFGNTQKALTDKALHGRIIVQYLVQNIVQQKGEQKC